MGGPLKWYHQAPMLDAMEQRPYHPPNVSGWEGGLAWLNTNTAQARFELVNETLYVKHTRLPRRLRASADVAGETADQAFDRAYAAVGSPWLSAGTASLRRPWRRAWRRAPPPSARSASTRCGRTSSPAPTPR